MRQIFPTALLLTALLPSLAHAQSPPQPECTTTTTVHCTGAAAPYAVQPQSTAPAPTIYPPNTYPPSSGLQLPLVLNLGEDTHLVQGTDGILYRERAVSTALPGVWGTGLGLLAGGWLISGTYSALDSSEGVPGLGFLPILGSWIQAAAVDGTGSKTFYAIDGVVQAGGFVMLLVGLAAGPQKLERMPVMITGQGAVGGGTIGLTGRF